MKKYISDLRQREGKRGGTQLLIGQGDVFYKNSGGCVTDWDYIEGLFIKNDFAAFRKAIGRAIGFTMMDCDQFPPSE